MLSQSLASPMSISVSRSLRGADIVTTIIRGAGKPMHAYGEVKILRFALTGSLAIALVGSHAASKIDAAGGLNPCAADADAWHAAALKTIHGRVIDLGYEDSCMGHDRVVQIEVRGTGADLLVDLGPLNLIEAQDLSFAIGDEVRVTGLIFAAGDLTTVVAADIERNGQKFVLRDADGQPAWDQFLNGISPESRRLSD